MADKPTRRRWLRPLIGQALILAALCFMGRYLVRNWWQIAPNLKEFRPEYIVMAGLATLAMEVLMPLGWSLATRCAGFPLQSHTAFRIYYRSSVFRYLPGSVWYLPTRAYLSQQQGVRVTTFTSSAALEMGLMLAIGGALAGAALAARLAALWPLAIDVACVVGVGIVVLWPEWLRRLVQREQAIGDCRRWVLLILVAIYLAVWLMYGISVALLFIGLGALAALSVGELAYTVCANAAGWLAGFLSFAPIGIGVREVALAGLFAPIASPAFVLLMSLVQRTLEILLEGGLWLVATLMHDGK